MLYDTSTMKQIWKKSFEGKDFDNKEVNYFFDSQLSIDGSYIITEDNNRRYLFDHNGEFVKPMDDRRMMKVTPYSETEIVGIPSRDDDTKLVAIDFLTLKERTLCKLDSGVRTFYIKNWGSQVYYQNNNSLYCREVRMPKDRPKQKAEAEKKKPDGQKRSFKSLGESRDSKPLGETQEINLEGVSNDDNPFEEAKELNPLEDTKDDKPKEEEKDPKPKEENKDEKTEEENKKDQDDPNYVDPDPEVIVEDFHEFQAVALFRNRIGVLYKKDDISWTTSLYSGTKKIWEKTTKEKIEVSEHMKFFRVELTPYLLTSGKKDGKIHLNIFGGPRTRAYWMKGIRNIGFQYPYLSYQWSDREFWVQNVDNTISVYFLDHPVIAVENTPKFDNFAHKKTSVKVALEQYNGVHFVELIYEEKRKMVLYDQVMIPRDNVMHQRLKTFYSVKGDILKDGSYDSVVIMQYPETVVFWSSDKRTTSHGFGGKYKKGNVIFLKSKNLIIFWKFKANKLEGLKLPIDSTDTSLKKLFDTDDEIQYCKPFSQNNEEFLLLFDEANNIKILEVDESESQSSVKLVIHQEYFVGNDFKLDDREDTYQGYSYCNKMLYNCGWANILKPKGRKNNGDKEMVKYGSYKFDLNNKKFPICSEDFVL